MTNQNISAKKKYKVSELIDAIEAGIASENQVSCPVKDLFTPGLYSREVFIPAGTYLTSKIHKTEHPYVVSLGKISVFTEEDGEVLIEAPFRGVTKPGTRRVLYAHTDVIWTTWHVTDKTTVEEVEDEIIEKHVNTLIQSKVKEINK